jgi:hypothetical protein
LSQRRAALSPDPRVQVKHQFAHRQHLIDEAKKAYAAKLVAEKAGGAKEGESGLGSVACFCRDGMLGLVRTGDV